MSDQPTTYIRTLGRYHLLDELGRGAMAVVYRGFDPVIGRTVALKTIAFDTGDAEANELRQRLYREACAAGTLTHPNIVTIYDVIEEGGTTAVAMEFIEGRTLGALVAERAPLPVDAALDIFDQIAAALDDAGAKGIVHRDIKPANIMITADGRVKVADFGVARIAVSTMTQTGTVVGSPSYMSPEQVRGQPLDGRSDLFSATVVLYELLTGERPFAGNDVATTMYRIVHEAPIEPATFNAAISPGLAAVLRRALAKNPDERYRTGAELCRELRRAMTLAAIPDVSATPAPARGRTKFYLAVATPLVLLLIVVVLKSLPGANDAAAPAVENTIPAAAAGSPPADQPVVSPAVQLEVPTTTPAAAALSGSAGAVSTIPSSAGAVSTIPSSAGAVSTIPPTPAAATPASDSPSPARTPAARDARGAAAPAAAPAASTPAARPSGGGPEAAGGAGSFPVTSGEPAPRDMPGAKSTVPPPPPPPRSNMALLQLAFDSGTFPVTLYADGRQVGRIDNAGSRVSVDPGRTSLRAVNESFFFDHDFGELTLAPGETRVLTMPSTASAYIGVRGDSYTGLRVTLDGRDLPGPYPAQLPRIAASRHRIVFKWSEGALSGVEVSDTIDLTGGRQFSIRVVPDNGQVVVQKLR